MRIREAIVVEGRYDKIRLSTAVDTIIETTDGFGIFRNAAQLQLLRQLAAQRGLIVLTDSDSAGFVIRDYLSGAIPPAHLKHAYCPEIVGKERRKAKPSKEGLLGVEGIEAEKLTEALRLAGAIFEDESAAPLSVWLTKARLFEDGLNGRADSAARRAWLMRRLGLPQKLSVNRLLAVLNATLTEKVYRQLLEDMNREEFR